jgi:apolipoprotein N-acyltransferase
VVRAANTGVSFFAGPDGRIHGATDLDTAGVALVQVWPRVGTTFYVLAGDWLPAIAIGGMLGLALVALWEQFRRRRAIKTSE